RIIPPHSPLVKLHKLPSSHLSHCSFSPYTATPPPALYTLSLHDALPIWPTLPANVAGVRRGADRLRLAGEPRGQERSVRRPGGEIGRAHVLTPVTWPYRMPSSA